MPIFKHGRFPKVGQKQKTERKERRRPKVGNNNGQLRIATPTRVAHAKPPGPKVSLIEFGGILLIINCFATLGLFLYKSV